MCSLIPDQPRSPEAGQVGEGCKGVSGAAVLWRSSSDGGQGGDFVYVEELRWATIELIVQPASASVESGLDLFEALK